LSIDLKSLIKANCQGRRLKRGVIAAYYKYKRYKSIKSKHNLEYTRRLHAIRLVEDKSESKYN
jgi:hypothetical protein